MASVNTTFNQLLETYHQSRIRGEWASLSLETKGGKEFITFTLGGPPGNHSGRPVSGQVRRKTPSQLRRDQKRKLEFHSKKEDTLSKDHSKDIDDKAGKHTNKLVIELEKYKDKTQKTEIASPILQLDGETSSEDAVFTFKSEYREEDILHAMTEILPEIRTTLVSRVAVKPFRREFSADHQCTVLVADQNFSWPAMKPADKEVFRELRRIQEFK